MIIHTVTPSDTIYSVSKQYGIPEARIITDNFLDPTKKLVVGQTLIISRPSKIFAVRGGDTLDSIAKENNISVLSILQNNPQVRTDKLTPSQTLNLSYDRTNARSIIVAAYSGDASLAQIEKYLPYISALIVQNAARIEDGNVSMLQDVSPTVSMAKKYRALPLLSLDCTNERGKWNGDCIAKLLDSPVATENFIQSAVKTAKANGFGGVEVSAAGLDTANGYRFVDMLLALQGVCGEHELICTSPLFPIDGFDTNEVNIADIASLVPLWNYIWDDDMAASPAAPLNKLQEMSNNSTIMQHKEKMLLGIPTFGVDYTEMGSGYRKNIINAADGISLTQKHHIAAEYNESTHTPFVRFEDNTHQRHIVHYEDARSISEKLDLLDALGLGGVNIMSLEYDSPVLWQILNQRYSIRKY